MWHDEPSCGSRTTGSPAPSFIRPSALRIRAHLVDGIRSVILLLAVLTLVLEPLGAQESGTGGDGAPAAPAVGRDSASIYVLEPLVVEGRYDDLTDIAVTASQGLVGHQDLKLRPLVREGELLETVPGLIMTQHSGDGKSNQMFVRGFNLDHGTDFSTKVEGMQVNIPTHAHGQGYTDLNFIIPELVDHVEYKLGSYYAEIGDFGSAGGAHLRLRRSLPEPLAVAGFGEDGYRRIVAAGSEDLGSGELLLGGEMKRYDGPWAIPQGLDKLSGLARYTWQTGDNLFSLLALGYDNDWDASDQIPRRLVQGDVIGRYSQVDSTLGGASSRYSLSGTWMREGGESSQRVDLYGILYELDLQLHVLPRRSGERGSDRAGGRRPHGSRRECGPRAAAGRAGRPPRPDGRPPDPGRPPGRGAPSER